MEKIFAAVQDLREEYRIIWAQIQEHKGAVKEIREAIKARLASEKRQTAERISILEEQIKDSGRTATARRFAERELQQLREKSLQITEEERKDFEDAMKAYEEAAADARSVYIQLTEAIQNARHELDGIAEWKGKKASAPLENWIAGERKEFDLLLKYAEKQEEA